MSRVAGEDGAYAILYGLLLVVVLSVAALVVDLATMRADRQGARLAADSASLAGARALDPLTGGDPRQACEDAWGYVGANMGIDDAGATACAGFPTATSPCPLTPVSADATSEGIRVVVTWPVLDDSVQMTQPDAQTGDDSTLREIDPETDGNDPCARLAVRVVRTADTFFAGLFGVDEQTSSATSVALATTEPGGNVAVAALNVLNETACQAVRTSGQGSILISSVDGREGIVSVESSGRQGSGGCPPNTFVIDPARTSSGAFVRADGPDGPGTGTILSYALSTTNGNPAEAYDPAIAPPSGTLLQPRPTLLSQRTGDAPVRDVYDCAAGDDCRDTYPESYEDTLRARLRSGTPQPYEHAETPWNVTPFQTLTAALAPGFNCTIGTTARVLVPPGNWFVNCATLRVQGTLVFAGGTVVTRGGVTVLGCLAVNVPLPSGSPSCPTVVGDDVSTPPSQGAILYLRGGDFTKGSSGSVLLPRTFVHMDDGHVDFGASSGAMFWTSPRQTDPLCATDACRASRFSKLALWNDAAETQSFGGQTSLTLRGVVFVPESLFSYTGQTAQHQAEAQFWADRIEVGGQSGLTMAPDPTNSVPTPALHVALIR